MNLSAIIFGVVVMVLVGLLALEKSRVSLAESDAEYNAKRADAAEDLAEARDKALTAARADLRRERTSAATARAARRAADARAAQYDAIITDIMERPDATAPADPAVLAVLERLRRARPTGSGGDGDATGGSPGAR